MLLNCRLNEFTMDFFFAFLLKQNKVVGVFNTHNSHRIDLKWRLVSACCVERICMCVCVHGGSNRSSRSSIPIIIMCSKAKLSRKFRQSVWIRWNGKCSFLQQMRTDIMMSTVRVTLPSLFPTEMDSFDDSVIKHMLPFASGKNCHISRLVLFFLSLCDISTFVDDVQRAQLSAMQWKEYEWTNWRSNEMLISSEKCNAR